MAGAKGRKVDKQGRSEGEPRWVQLPYWVMESPTFLSLSAAEITVLLFLLKRFNGRNNGAVSFGVRSGCFVPKQGTGEMQDKAIPVTRSGIGRALETLERFGFIVCTQEATFHQKRLTRNWRLTMWPCDGSPASKEFMVLSAADCRLIRATKTKASPTSGTMEVNTVPPAGLCPSVARPNTPLQSHQRDYEPNLQSHQRDTSSNHPIEESTGEVAAA